MSVKASIKSITKNGVKTYLKTFEKKIKDNVNIAGNLVRNTAVQSILSGGKSGKVYEKYNPRRTHRSSADGQPPASDTGFLASNIVVNLDTHGLTANVESRAEYSIYLEFGTQKMKARPFMQPALEENRPKIRRMFATTKGKAK